MWALLGDEDPGHSATTVVDAVEEAPQADNIDGSILVGGVNPAKRGKTTKTTKKKGEMTAAPTTEFRKEMAGKLATGGSRGRKVAWCVCWVNIAIAFLVF
jgi:hypothetical protein